MMYNKYIWLGGDTLKYGIGDSYYIAKYGLDKAFLKIKEHGYSCIDEQSLFVDTTQPHFSSPINEFDRTMLTYKQKVAEAGLIISQAHGPWRWHPSDMTEEDRAERFEKMEKSLYGCSLLGCDNLVVHPISPFGWDNTEHQDELYNMNLEYYERLAEKGKEYGVTVCFENMPWCFMKLAHPKECLSFVKEINSDFLKLCLDTGHCLACKQSPADAVRMYGKKYLRCLHVHDNHGGGDEHLLPYQGIADWKDFNKALHEIGFEGSVSLETSLKFSPPDDVAEYFEIAIAKLAEKIAL